MKRTVLCLTVLLCLFSFVSGASAVSGQEVEYRDNGLVMKGYLAYNDKVGAKMPGVLVVHEWWGHNDYARKRARMLARLGYAALAVDFISYPGVLHSFTNPDADEYAKKFNMKIAYDSDADQKSWKELKKFLKAIFKP
ncbi:MAG: hypothetical protein OHK006_08770 [Thermodesulfovibrionales bacterium]